MIHEVGQDAPQKVITDPVVSIEEHDHGCVVLILDDLRDRFIEGFRLRAAIDKDDPTAMTCGDRRRFVGTAICYNDDFREPSSLTVAYDLIDHALFIVCGDHSDGVSGLVFGPVIGPTQVSHEREQEEE